MEQTTVIIFMMFCMFFPSVLIFLDEKFSKDVKYVQTIKYVYVNEKKEKVKKYAKIFFDDTSDFYFIEGKVENTLKIKKNIPKKISLLRLDTDYYTSTKIELEKLYEKLSKGGILIIDDYGDMRGAKKAVDDFFRNKKSLLIRIDKSCRVLIKN
jgi:bifunctional ADP-heptose synthase (sugar kinase/adenylyltransferase)